MNFLYILLIRPVEYLLEIVFNLLYRFTGNVPYALLGLSLSVSLLTLPLYNRAEQIAEKERKKKEEMEIWTSRIRKTFHGDERSMMLQKYYRIKNYRPYEALKGSLSLVLQIPFFAAAYHLLSTSEILNARSFMGIKDLSQPDGLLPIFGVPINLLPIVMTLISLLAGSIYTAEFKWKDKWNVFLLPLLFLGILYNSPSGLVLYWIGNNVFSLVKNIVARFSRHALVWRRLAEIVLGVLFAGAAFLGREDDAVKLQLGILTVYFVFIIAENILLYRYGVKSQEKENNQKLHLSKRSWILAVGVMVVAFGAWIPLNLLAASPLEFIIRGYMEQPLHYVAYTLLTAIGLFGLGGGLVYYLGDEKKREVFTMLMVFFAFSSVINFGFFGKMLKTIGANLVYPQRPEFYGDSTGMNLMIMVLLPLLIVLFAQKKGLLEKALVICLFCVSVMVGKDYISTSGQLSKYIEEGEEDVYSQKMLHLSKEGKNVVVIMLDRAISGYFPYILEEKPDLYNSFAGFTFYPKTLCFAPTTNAASHAAYGGYEYIPDEYSKRIECTTDEVATEAQKVLPVLFYENGYEVTMCDPPSTGAFENSRLYIYSDYPGIETYNLLGRFTDKEIVVDSLDLVERNFFLYSLFRSLPEIVGPAIYDEGAYMDTEAPANMTFMFSYAEMDVLPEITEVNQNETGCFMYIYSMLTHEPTALQMPDYVPAHLVDNSAFRTPESNRFFDNVNYSVNMAAALRLGEWFDWMKEAGVYDNTRIIIVADHGCDNGDFEEMKCTLSSGQYLDIERFNPLLLYKDFDATEYSVSDEFMTNADVPYLAVNGLISNPRNPFTGVSISQEQKANTPLYVSTQRGKPAIVGGIQNSGEGWYSVNGDMFEAESWEWHEP